MLGVKVFTATKSSDRHTLGEKVTTWIQDNGIGKILKTEVRQSSDREFHCLTIVLFYDKPEV